MDKASLRKQLRQQRRQLSATVRERHSQAICQHLAAHTWLRTARQIALYLPNDGEPDVTGLIALLGGRNRHYHLPCLRGFGKQHMTFGAWEPGDELTPNRYCIPEPAICRSIPRWALSVVLVPLVGFDDRGNRLGMGAGYYDRTFQLRRDNRRSLPRLIGVAHDFQQLESLPSDPWDIPLDLVVTNQGLVQIAR